MLLSLVDVFAVDGQAHGVDSADIVDPPDGSEGINLLPATLDPAGELSESLRAELTELTQAATAYAAAAQATATTRAYESDWAQFTAWCQRYSLQALPAAPATCGLFLTSLAHRGLKVSTVRRRAASIARTHRLAGHTSPTWDPAVLNLLEGIARTHGVVPNKKVALLRDALLDIVDRIDISSVAGLRDRALLLLGFAVGLRRSELVALTVKDLTPSPDGVTIRLGQSKTDQQGAGYDLLVLYAEPPRPCPVRALRAWLDHAEITTGEIFRRVTRSGAVSSPLSGQSVALILKKRVQAAGLDPRNFAGHSLRAGYATQAARDGHHATQIADVTRHRDQRVLNGYIRAGRNPKDIARVL